MRVYRTDPDLVSGHERLNAYDHTREHPYYSAIVRIMFTFYMFFIFFGTSVPFRVRPTDLAEIGTSNLANQIIFGSLFLVSAGCLFLNWSNFIAFIKREKFLTLFLAWCFLSIFWSDHSFISFKRWFQILTTVTVSIALLLDMRRPDEYLKYFKGILYLYIVLTYLSILLVPGAIDPKHLTWRGLTVGKNYLGQTALVSILFWIYSLKTASGKKKAIYLLMAALSVILLIGAFSMSSILTFALLVFVGVLLAIDRLIESIRVGRVFSGAIFASSLLLVFSFYYFAPDLVNSGFNEVGKDASFTGRTFLWADIFQIAEKHLLVGCGFSGFWVVESNALYRLYEKYVWLPNEAHEGYLDILNETGIIGIFLLFLMIFFYFRRLSKLETPHFGKWFIITIMILNLQESTLFRQNVLTGVLFIFFYLVLQNELFFREHYPERSAEGGDVLPHQLNKL